MSNKANTADFSLTEKFFSKAGPVALAGFLIGAGGVALSATAGMGSLALGAHFLKPAIDVGVFGSVAAVGASIGTMVGGTGIAFAADMVKNAFTGPK